MLKLRKILQVTFANKFVIRNADSDMEIIWQGRKHSAGYDVLRRIYDDYEVAQIRASKDGIITIDIMKESWL